MLNDITIGQYYPISSPVHRLDARNKLLSLIAYIVFIFLCNSVVSLCFLIVFTGFTTAATKVPVKMYLKSLKPILPIIIITALLNIFYVNDGRTLIHFWIINVTVLGIRKAVFMAVRILLMIVVSSVLTYTTTPTQLTDAIESLLKPLKYIGLGTAVHTVAMMMTIALRFIPTLVDETDKLMNAQRARGADFESGGLIARAKALIPILIPLLISSVRRAVELSEAMESRCYTGNGNRTRMKQLRYGICDLYSFLILVLGMTSVILFNNVAIV